MSHAFSLLDLINPVIQKVSNDVPLRLIAEKSLQHIQTGFVYFTCPEHENWGRKFVTRTVVNIFYKNEQKRLNDTVRQRTK